MSADVPPSDDEREALARLILGYDPRELHNATPHDWQLWGRFLERADAIIASDVWRNRRQGQITDEAVEAAAYRYWLESTRDAEGDYPDFDWEPDEREQFMWAARVVLEAAERVRSAAQVTTERAHDRDRDGICRRCGHGLTALEIIDGEKPCAVPSTTEQERGR